jgi:hypothetical protein
LIHEAYRNLARLLHPDAQTDPVLKASAEAQMKRINPIYQALADPERRRRYDRGLAVAEESPAPVIVPGLSPIGMFQRNRGAMVWVGAAAICAGFIFWLASRDAGPASGYSPSPAVTTALPVVVKKKAAPATVSVAAPRNPVLDRQRDDEVRSLREQLAAMTAERDRLRRQLAEMAGSVTPPEVMPAADPNTALPGMMTKPAPVAPPEAPDKKLAGTWRYRHTHDQGKSKATYPPEFIEAVIREENGRLRGRYLARFHIADQKVSPDVEFQFEGKVSGQAAKFPWVGPGGAAGEVQLRMVSDTSLEVTWWATSLDASMGLASGTAVLNK